MVNGFPASVPAPLEPTHPRPPIRHTRSHSAPPPRSARPPTSTTASPEGTSQESTARSSTRRAPRSGSGSGAHLSAEGSRLTMGTVRTGSLYGSLAFNPGVHGNRYRLRDGRACSRRRLPRGTSSLRRRGGLGGPGEPRRPPEHRHPHDASLPAGARHRDPPYASLPSQHG